jgi:hypothetical protein
MIIGYIDVNRMVIDPAKDNTPLIIDAQTPVFRKTPG